MLGQNLGLAPRLIPTLGNDTVRREFHRLLNDHIQAVDARRAKVWVPRAAHLMQPRPGMHYHLRPEIFLQLSGETRFRFPGRETLSLRPGELAVLATGLPHGEEARPGPQGEAFRNLVVGFYSSSVSMHFAADAGNGRPDIEQILFFPTPDLKRLIDLVDYLTLLGNATTPGAEAAVRGLTLAMLAVLGDLARTETPELRQEPQRIFQVKWLVRDQIYNRELNVILVAQRLGCSADYLSHLFHKETGETLIHYIHRQRIAGAVQALANPILSISEIAWACGFADPGYFTRVFRKHTGLTPQAYRASRIEEEKRESSQPKTIYHDRVDYSPGVDLKTAG